MRPSAVPDSDGGWSVGVRPIGNLSLSFDHRAFDGAYAAAFLALVRDILVERDWHEEL
jgi:2-oxoglutarate dehydrogenase E2 component (dihydrolipoamide succinyltransferase)